MPRQTSGVAVDAQLLGPPRAQLVLRQHAENRLANHPVGLVHTQSLRRHFLQSTRVPAVRVINLLLDLVTGHANFVRVDDHNMIARVQIRREAGLILAHQHARDLENELKQQNTASTEAKKKLEGLDQPRADVGELKTVSLLLPPPTRGLSSLKTVIVHPDTDLVVLRLTLESADFPRYSVTVKDPATNAVVWKSSELDVRSAGDRKIVSAGLRANLLKERNYIAEVAGLTNAGRQRVVGDYPFHIVLK